MKFDKLLESLAKIDEIVVNRPDATGQTWSKSQQELEYLLTHDCQSTHKDLCRLEKELHDLNMTFQTYVEQGMKANGKVPNKKAFEQMEKGYKAIRDAIQKTLYPKRTKEPDSHANGHRTDWFNSRRAAQVGRTDRTMGEEAARNREEELRCSHLPSRTEADGSGDCPKRPQR